MSLSETDYTVLAITCLVGTAFAFGQALQSVVEMLPQLAELNAVGPEPIEVQVKPEFCRTIVRKFYATGHGVEEVTTWIGVFSTTVPTRFIWTVDPETGERTPVRYDRTLH